MSHLQVSDGTYQHILLIPLSSRQYSLCEDRV